MGGLALCSEEKRGTSKEPVLPAEKSLGVFNGKKQRGIYKGLQALQYHIWGIFDTTGVFDLRW